MPSLFEAEEERLKAEEREQALRYAKIADALLGRATGGQGVRWWGEKAVPKRKGNDHAKPL